MCGWWERPCWRRGSCRAVCGWALRASSRIVATVSGCVSRRANGGGGGSRLATSFDCGSGTPGSVPAGLIMDGSCWVVNPPRVGNVLATSCVAWIAASTPPRSGHRRHPCYPPYLAATLPECLQGSAAPLLVTLVHLPSYGVPRLRRRAGAWGCAAAPTPSALPLFDLCHVSTPVRGGSARSVAPRASGGTLEHARRVLG